MGVRRFAAQTTVERVEKVLPLLSSHKDENGQMVDTHGQPVWNIHFRIGNVPLSFTVNTDPELLEGQHATVTLEVIV